MIGPVDTVCALASIPGAPTSGRDLSGRSRTTLKIHEPDKSPTARTATLCPTHKRGHWRDVLSSGVSTSFTGDPCTRETSTATLGHTYTTVAGTEWTTSCSSRSMPKGRTSVTLKHSDIVKDPCPSPPAAMSMSFTSPTSVTAATSEDSLDSGILSAVTCE
ncbi:hypothetical protein IscW_ISCW020285 [Ixodes scapularis]|uniref:Uncharacterized protein n=1 Tax=Ixodes scapularis TaxID=6945 RepID=B7Q339_IXOSC|nr:hypothetical protein IscW_ISCW020285 [Ixodes scapularis]|eukprot:XP_002411137.1 hypothetical protein IscW_ISCW020285 [Ixodes scapularis]